MTISTPVSSSDFDRCRSDFVYFCETYLKVNHPKEGLVPFKLYDYQKRFIEHIESNQFSIAKKFRQGGFTTLICAYFFWKALFELDKKFLLMSKTNWEARAVLRMIRLFWENLPADWREMCELSKPNNYDLIIGENKIMARDLSPCCGLAIDYFFGDDMAFWPNTYGTWNVLYPTISNSKVIVVSTPDQFNGWFYDTYQAALKDENMFEVFECSYTEHPDYQDKDSVQKLKDQVGPKRFAQEFEAQFVNEVLPKGDVWDNDKPIKLVYDEEYNFSGNYPETPVEGIFFKPKEVKPEKTEPSKTEEVKAEVKKQETKIDSKKTQPHNKKAPPQPHNNGIWSVNPDWREYEKECSIKEMLDEPVPFLKNKRDSIVKSDFQNLAETLVLCGIIPENSRVVENIKKEDKYSKLILDTVLDEELPPELEVTLGEECLEIQGIPTKIKSKSVKESYDGLSSLVGEEEARQYVATVLKEQIKKLF